jgi:Zn-dependent protease with chaperone function
MRIRTRILIGSVAIVLLIAFGDGAIATGNNKIVSLAVLVLAYISGIFALLTGMLLSFLGFLGSLPFFSSLFAYAAFLASKFHYFLFRVILGKTLKQTSWYRRFELGWKNNETVRSFVTNFHSVLRNLGFEKPMRIKFFEVTVCTGCGEDIPVEGAYCPFCGQEVSG